MTPKRSKRSSHRTRASFYEHEPIPGIWIGFETVEAVQRAALSIRLTHGFTTHTFVVAPVSVSKAEHAKGRVAAMRIDGLIRELPMPEARLIAPPDRTSEIDPTIVAALVGQARLTKITTKIEGRRLAASHLAAATTIAHAEGLARDEWLRWAEDAYRAMVQVGGPEK